MTEFHESMAFLYIHVTATLHAIETNGKLKYLPQTLTLILLTWRILWAL